MLWALENRPLSEPLDRNGNSCAAAGDRPVPRPQQQSIAASWASAGGHSSASLLFERPTGATVRISADPRDRNHPLSVAQLTSRPPLSRASDPSQHDRS